MQRNLRKTPPVYKIIILGESNVGKSSLFLRYTEDTFKNTIANTIGINNTFKELIIDDNPVHLQIWDTAGQERFKSIVSAFYRESDGFIFVYDVTSQRSFDYMKNLIDELKDIVVPSFTAVVGNKIDSLKTQEQKKEKQKIENLAKAYKFKAYLTSAKTGQAVNDVFEDLSKNLFYNKPKQENNIETIDISRRKKKWKRWC